MNNLNFKKTLEHTHNNENKWDILLVFLPVVGWFSLFGYFIRVIQRFVVDKSDQRPNFKFQDDFSLGVFMFLKAIPFAIIYLIIFILIDSIRYLHNSGQTLLMGIFHFVNIFLTPILLVNFADKKTVDSLAETSTLKIIFVDFRGYITTLLRTLTIIIVFLGIYSIVIGIPVFILR